LTPILACVDLKSMKSIFQLFKILVLTLAPFALNGCATSYVNPQLQLSDESDYFSSLEHFTSGKKVYDGLYQTIEFSGSLLNSEVSKFQIDQNARIYQWNLDQYNLEKSNRAAVLASKTEVFLSFFTPERKNDDLNKVKTKWKIFLDANGKRYEAKIEKMKAQYSEVISLYRNHNRWSTPYKLTFDVPTATIENSTAKLTITGPVGSASIDFNNIQR
jgi:hypothetical protein